MHPGPDELRDKAEKCLDGILGQYFDHQLVRVGFGEDDLDLAGLRRLGYGVYPAERHRAFVVAAHGRTGIASPPDGRLRAGFRPGETESVQIDLHLAGLGQLTPAATLHHPAGDAVCDQEVREAEIDIQVGHSRPLRSSLLQAAITLL